MTLPYDITQQPIKTNTMTDQIQQLHARIAELEAENKGLQVFAASHQRTLERCLDLKAECAELEAMLDAVGAGGVGESIHPQVQPDTSPAAWAIFTKGGFCRMWSQDRALIERTAAELGVKAEPMYRCTGRAPQPHTRARGSHNPAPQPTKTTP